MFLLVFCWFFCRGLTLVSIPLNLKVLIFFRSTLILLWNLSHKPRNIRWDRLNIIEICKSDLFAIKIQCKAALSHESCTDNRINQGRSHRSVILGCKSLAAQNQPGQQYNKSFDLYKLWCAGMIWITIQIFV